MPLALQADCLAGIPHGFMTRLGGASTGQVAGLQCGYGAGDDPALVAQNRKTATEAVLPGAALVTPHQTHSAIAIVADEPWLDDSRPVGDALVTDKPGLLLGIVTADCAPVLLADSEAGVVAAAHAGWRGAHGGVIEATIAAMEGLGARPDRIRAVIGPCIAQDSYEVGADFRAQFSDNDDRFFAPGKPGHLQFNLETYVAHRLASAGVAEVEPLGRDTYADEDHFYSFRRATHRGEPDYGRQLSLIGLPLSLQQSA